MEVVGQSQWDISCILSMVHWKSQAHSNLLSLQIIFPLLKNPRHFGASFSEIVVMT